MRSHLLIVAMCHFALPCANAQRDRSPASVPPASMWDRFLPAITAMARASENDEQLNASVLEAANFSGLATALIDLGCCGAYADDIYVVQIRHGKPAKARFWPANGPHAPDLEQGASTMHGVDVSINKKWNAIVSTRWENSSDGEVLANCSQDTYLWNAHHQRFEWSRNLSYRHVAPACGKFEDLR